MQAAVLCTCPVRNSTICPVRPGVLVAQKDGAVLGVHNGMIIENAASRPSARWAWSCRGELREPRRRRRQRLRQLDLHSCMMTRTSWRSPSCRRARAARAGAGGAEQDVPHARKTQRRRGEEVHPEGAARPEPRRHVVLRSLRIPWARSPGVSTSVSRSGGRESMKPRVATALILSWKVRLPTNGSVFPEGAVRLNTNPAARKRLQTPSTEAENREALARRHPGGAGVESARAPSSPFKHPPAPVVVVRRRWRRRRVPFAAASAGTGRRRMVQRSCST